jgi:hypothetical protein
MADVDTMVLKADPTTTTMLAAHLNAAMAQSHDAQEAYARIYGVQWSALGNGAAINDGATTTAKTAR